MDSVTATMREREREKKRGHERKSRSGLYGGRTRADPVASLHCCHLVFDTNAGLMLH